MLPKNVLTFANQLYIIMDKDQKIIFRVPVTLSHALYLICCNFIVSSVGNHTLLPGKSLA